MQTALAPGLAAAPAEAAGPTLLTGKRLVKGPSREDDGGHGLDELGWISAGVPGRCTSPAAMVGGAVARETNGATHEQGVRVQIELPGGWRDCSPEETRQICERLTECPTAFRLHARGQNYDIDFSSPDGAKQTNVSTGKKRRLRILDAGDELPPRDDPVIGDVVERAGSLPASPEVALQREYGPQSKRGGASQHPLGVLNDNPHAQECFSKFLQNEVRLCGEWAVFYHSYSFAALLYEVQAAVGSVLFRFRSQFAPLPRILVHEFDEIPDAWTLVQRFNSEFTHTKRDHHPSFRRVALSVMCSLASTGPEACVAMVFIAGYSCKDLSFRSVLENLLESCYVPKPKVRRLAEDIVALSEKHGLDVSQFGGRACKSGKVGHLLQVFIKRHLVDRLVYAAKPYGPVDEERMPASKWANSDRSFSVGQARIVAHPKYFMQANSVRMFVASADPTFHRNRRAFQEELVRLLGMILGEPSLRERAATGIYGGTLPSWWTSEDQRKLA
eukprot:CAMPEP_0168419274 /NCGR_PEP_ID=MMETSP0228-20121227/32185_1 /TAXON_ID=133427 /ORGANISM="Protoceratium reticulatum, Strain CCCM 535 (=CCMP 1889)" /LENGTH=501 /DNA_ID=CAMNT_0008433153 /DNA_START=46 /DNA_END=1552 /DNA_ORIENTATION=-